MSRCEDSPCCGHDQDGCQPVSDAAYARHTRAAYARAERAMNDYDDGMLDDY